jgi:putative ABC transport system permease protein
MNLAWRDIRHGPGRFVLTCVGLSLLLGVVMGMTAIYRGLVAEALGLIEVAQADVWVVEGGKRGPFAESSRIPRDTRDAIQAHWGVAAAGAVVYQSVEVPHRGATLRVFVIGAEFGRPGGEFQVVRGRHILKSRYELLADPRTGLQLGEQVRIGRNDFTVVGLLSELSSSGGDPVVVMTLRDGQIVQSQFDPSAVHRDLARPTSATGSSDLVNAVVVRLSSASAASEVIASIRRWKHLSAISGPEQEAILTRSVVDRARKQIGMFTAILLAVTTVVIGLIVYTMTMDKRKAIATLKLIGAPDRTIVMLVLQQALAMGVIGFAFGAIAIRIGKDYFPRRLVFEPTDTLLLFCVVTVVALLASVIGIRSALRIDPASALSG